MKKNKKKNKWIKPRHKTVRAILGVFVELYVKRRYGIKIEPCNDRRPLLIL